MNGSKDITQYSKVCTYAKSGLMSKQNDTYYIINVFVYARTQITILYNVIFYKMLK